jgi:hypothetical protein
MNILKEVAVLINVLYSRRDVGVLLSKHTKVFEAGDAEVSLYYDGVVISGKAFNMMKELEKHVHRTNCEGMSEDEIESFGNDRIDCPTEKTFDHHPIACAAGFRVLERKFHKFLKKQLNKKQAYELKYKLEEYLFTFI